ncbi:MAG: hypothetical protein HKN24_05605 [Acidimicrobiales bacterium]|nr:hypothetical protein [Acidimicrobiales bacterium]
MRFVGPEIIVILTLIIPMLTIAAIVDLLRRPASSWPQSGQSQAVWALVIIFIGLVGPILYFTIAKPKLDAATYR